MGPIKEILAESQFQEEVTVSSQAKLVVVDFTASWCGPCQTIAPIYEQLSRKYPNAVFLKVDVDKCQETAVNQRVSVMPTFHFYRNKVKVDSCQGADPQKLEEKIVKYYDDGTGESDVGVAGHMDLSSFIQKNQCEALNESDDHPMEHCLTNQEGSYLESECDEQLILSLTFNQSVKIHSIKLKAPSDNGPKRLKIFINQPNTLDFDAATNNQSVQDIDLQPSDLEGTPVALRFVKFQNVQNIQIFVQSNQEDAETTRIDHLQLIGSPIVTTNMGDFKRVANKNVTIKENY